MHHLDPTPRLTPQKLHKETNRGRLKDDRIEEEHYRRIFYRDEFGMVSDSGEVDISKRPMLAECAHGGVRLASRSEESGKPERQEELRTRHCR